MVDIQFIAPSMKIRCTNKHIRRHYVHGETEEQCKHSAMYCINGNNLCKVHAGQEALSVICQQQIDLINK